MFKESRPHTTACRALPNMSAYNAPSGRYAVRISGPRAFQRLKTQNAQISIGEDAALNSSRVLDVSLQNIVSISFFVASRSIEYFV